MDRCTARVKGMTLCIEPQDWRHKAAADLLNGWMGRPQQQLQSCLPEVCQSLNWQILLVLFGLNHAFFCLQIVKHIEEWAVSLKTKRLPQQSYPAKKAYLFDDI